MWAVIFTLFMPVLPLLIWKSYNRERKLQVRELLARYVIYTLVLAIAALAALALFGDEGTSLLMKADASVGFAIRYLLVETAAVLLVAAAEWYFSTDKLCIRLNREQWETAGVVRFTRKVLAPGWIYFLAAAVIALNVSLMFDNVLWGDEAFSANTVRNNVAGIMQIVHYWENHPPLYYLWLRLWVNLLGHEGWVLHFASLVPFMAGILVAVTAFRKRFGNIPAAFFIVISGLAGPCVQYNLEIRMYSLAFFAVIMAFYCAYRILCGGSLAWFGVVFWGLVAAYTHYYGMMISGILIFVTGMAAILRFRGKTWIKSLLSLVMYIVGYLPWLREMLKQTQSVQGNWWNETILPPGEALDMIGAGSSFRGIVLGLGLLFTLALVLSESKIFRLEKKDSQTVVTIEKPNMESWSVETYLCVIGWLTIVGTLAAAYLLCIVVNPVLAKRYLYMLIAISAGILVMGARGVFLLLKKAGGKDRKLSCAYGVGKGILLLVLCLMIVRGIGDYRAYSETVKTEKANTEEVLSLIGTPDPEVEMVCNNVKHLGWTVLYHYYPDNEIRNEFCLNIEAERFWYFSGSFLSEEEMDEMTTKGYQINAFGEKMFDIYPIVLYYFEK